MKEILKIKEKVAARKVDDEMVLVPLVNDVADMKTIFTLNEVAAYIWENISESDNLESLSEKVVSEFNTDKETAKKDISSFFETIKLNFNIL